MNWFLAVIGFFFLLLAIFVLFRKKVEKKREYHVGSYDSEDTIVLKILINLWKSAPNWLASTFLFLIAGCMIYLAM